MRRVAPRSVALLEDHVSPPGAQLARKQPGGLLLVELLDAYHAHAQRYYLHTDESRKGQPTSMIYEARLVIRSLRELYGDTPAAEFGPLAMKSVMHSWVSDTEFH